MEEDELRDAIQNAIDEMLNEGGYNDNDPDDKIVVTWVSKFGKMPEQPHAFVIISDGDISNQLAGDGHIRVMHNGNPLLLEVDICPPNECTKDDEEPQKVCVKGVPTDLDEETLEEQLRDFFYPIADIEEVIIPRSWRETEQVFLKLYDEESAGYITKVAFFATFRGHLMRCSFAKKRKPRPERSPNPPRNITNGNTRSRTPPSPQKQGPKKAKFPKSPKSVKSGKKNKRAK